MARRILWAFAFAALLAPAVALGVRWRDLGAAERYLAVGEAALLTPVERVPALEGLDAARAQRWLEAARRSDPEGPVGQRARALWHTAQALQDLSRGEAALAGHEAELASRISPDEPLTALVAAAAAVRRGERAEAERWLEPLAPGAARRRGVHGVNGVNGNAQSREVPAEVTARAALLRSDLLLESGRPHEALAAAEALDRAHPAVSAVANLLGLCRSAVGDPAGAREAFERAAALDPRGEAPLVNLARLEREAGDLAGARAVLERALGVAPESADAWLAYGVVLADLRAPGARAALVRAGQLAPDKAAPWAAQGSLDLAEDNAAGAAESFRAALAREPDDAPSRANLGVALARRGDRAGAREAFEQAARRAPYLGEAWNGLGSMQLQMGEPAAAVAALQQACVLLPRDPNPAMNLGMALEALGRWGDAVRAYRDVLRRAPGHAGALRRLAVVTGEPVAR